jgi:hypothetical protein
MNKTTKREDFETELELRRLMLGGDIPPAKVRSEICPGCPFRTPFCDFHMSIILVKDNENARTSCKGTRAWVIERI